MSHFPERNEKVCLNCGSLLHGRYCHECGQENIEPQESFWHLTTHFIYDLTHFDGKFFSTLKFLLFRPGFLSREYFKGRRSGYLHPVKMYVFTSAFFFLIFFSFYGRHTRFTYNESKKHTADSISGSLKSEVEKKSDKADNAKVYSSKQYDSAQNTLPETKRDGRIERAVTHRALGFYDKYRQDPKGVIEAMVEKFTHLFPQMLFVSLPLFSLALSLLYIRRKQFYYVNHVVYTLHLYCAIFIMILVSLLLGSFFSLFHWDANKLLSDMFSLLILFYGYKAMRGFYGQSPKKTFFKYFLSLLLGLVVMLFVFMIFGTFSAFTI
ncbi:DUF3667 domain-containing protein [Asinibacterium sp. OR53]|uniref:DUF3667 domain-containing protein n=1 Tax=Asinibacterium sp. OR53 TaxID=925409 RepID=UPI00047A1DA3|nr:DUF3667 domain-containing protein [Asinibacterium sp. OR53]